MDKMTDKQRAPQTLLEFAGVESQPNNLSESILLIIDAQKEFSEGKLKLPGIEPAMKEAERILNRARKIGIPIIHITHQNKSGAALFNPDEKFVEIIERLKPKQNEIVVNKSFANAFYKSRLNEELEKNGRKNLIIFGYMTHMAVDATIRAATERGYQTTLIGDACAARDLSDGYGKVFSAEEVHNTTLVVLRDRFACVIKSETELPD